MTLEESTELARQLSRAYMNDGLSYSTACIIAIFCKTHSPDLTFSTAEWFLTLRKGANEPFEEVKQC